MTNILCYSYARFTQLMQEQKINDETVGDRHAVFICFHNSDDTASRLSPRFKLPHHNVLELVVDDIEASAGGGVYDMDLRDYVYPMLFDGSHADQIIDLLEWAKREGIDDVRIHCTAGIARSGATAVFASEFFGMPYNVLKYSNPQIMPNEHILNTLRKRYKARKEQV